ncbi:UDP-3-O-acyl-N-acetylglucosamine deacetylase [Kiritimatiellaeota bacterium B1221]|nr:UDP-3-O-acyl-N-acetylglucosamine deacetylase [Kiritimatiellaeota bacterium B1221]
MSNTLPGIPLAGDQQDAQNLWNLLQSMPVDEDCTDQAPEPIRKRRTTIASPVSVQGPGTFFGKETRTIEFLPTEREGWWFDRGDHPDWLRIQVAIQNVWTTGQVVSNIVLRSGQPHNYVRLVEHIIALRMGMGIDDLTIKIDSGDPPLFDVGSMPLVEALESVGTVDSAFPLEYVTVKEPVHFSTPEGKLLVFEPADPNDPKLELDCGISFPNVIGEQRIKLVVNRDTFRRGAHARTNTTAQKKLYCQSIGKLFADVRNLGYTDKNVLIAGTKKYHNEPEPSLWVNNKSLEAVWHRAILDLLAAIALIESGNFIGKVSSYKAGHAMDVQAVKALYRNDLLTKVEMPGDEPLAE